MKLANMAGMALLLKETTDTRPNDQIEAEATEFFTEVLDHNALPLDGDYSLTEWTSFKNNMELSRFLRFED